MGHKRPLHHLQVTNYITLKQLVSVLACITLFLLWKAILFGVFSPLNTLKDVVNYQLMYHLTWTFLACPQLAHQGHTNPKVCQEESPLAFPVRMKITPLHLEVHPRKIVSARRAIGPLARPVKVCLPPLANRK